MFEKIKSLLFRSYLIQESKKILAHKLTFGILILLLSVTFGLLIWHANDKSATYDEIGHTQCGFYHWRHFDFDRGLEHPPLIRLIAAFPLTFLNLDDPMDRLRMFREKIISVKREQLYGTILLYQNKKADADLILILARLMIIFLTLGLCYLVFIWARLLYGASGGWISLFLMITTPSLLGHGSLVTTDVGGIAAAMLFLYCLAGLIRSPSIPSAVLTGIALGLAQASKLSNIFLILVFFFTLIIYPRLSGQNIWKRLGIFTGALIVCGLVINICYAFQNFFPPHEIHPQDLAAYEWSPFTQWIYRWLPLPDFYLMSVGFMTHHVRSGFSTFILGNFYPKGVWYYFPLIFLLKTPVVSLLSIGGALFSLKKKWFNTDEFILLFTGLVYTIIVSFSNLNLGIRHYLIMYPLLFIFVGRLSHFLPLIDKRKWLIIVPILFQLLEVLYVSPHFLAYYNLAVGGPQRGIHYTSDLDYGQDLKSLGKYLESHPKSEIVLSYFGTALPQYYGIEAQELLPTGSLLLSKKINNDYPAKEFLAISASHLQGHMTGPDTFGWLRERNPAAVLGYSMYVYDITKDIESHEKLAILYQQRNESEKFKRHKKRIAILKSESAQSSN